MKYGLGSLVRDVLGFVFARVLNRISSGPRDVVTDEELHDALHVGGPTQDAVARAREVADERWPKPRREDLQ